MMVARAGDTSINETTARLAAKDAAPFIQMHRTLLTIGMAPRDQLHYCRVTQSSCRRKKPSNFKN
jgi:hypothetical protein